MNELEKLFGDLKHFRTVLSATASVDELSDVVKIRRRRIYLFSEIQEEDNPEDNTGYIIKCMHLMDEISSDPITMMIHSPGGDILAGMSIIQTMRDLRSPVHTLVVGQAASMAAAVAVAGAKRFAYPCARWLLHRGKGSAEGDSDDIAIEAKELRTIDTYADQVILNHTKIPTERLSRMQRKNYWLGVREALQFGLIDDVVTPSQGPSDWNAWLPDPKRIRAKQRQDEEDEEEEKEKPTNVG